MSLNLANIAETAVRLQNTSNQNVVDSNILKLDRKLRDIQTESRKLQEDKARLRKLKKSIDVEKQQMQTQKTAIQNQQEMIRHQMAKHKSAKLMVTEASLEQRKEHKNLQKTLSQISQELTATKRKLMSEQRKGGRDKEKKLKQIERRYHAEKKNNKSIKRELDSVLAELTITKRKLISAQRKGGKGGALDAKYKSMLRKWMKGKKKLKLATMEFEDRSIFYRRQLANFKKQQAKWLKKQRSTMKNKKHAMKYVFMEDMVAIKINTKYKDRVKIITSKGQEILVPKVRVIIEKEKKKKNNKTKKRKKNHMHSMLEEDASWMEQDQIVQELLDDIAKEEDYESSFFQTELLNQHSTDEEDEFDEIELIRGDVMEWKQEMTQRNEDLSILMSIASNYRQNNENMEHLNFDELIEGIVDRNKLRFEEMDEDDEKEVERKNAYDESRKLLREECDQYLHSLQNAISSIQIIIESNSNTMKRNSALLSPLSATASTPSLLSPTKAHSLQLSSLHSLQLSGSLPNLADVSSNEFASDSLSMFNPYTIAEELSNFYMAEMNSRSKDIKMMLEIFYSSRSNENKDSFKSLDDVVRGIDFRMDEVEDNDALVVQYLVNMQNWKAQLQEYVMRMALVMKELSERRQEMKEIFDVIDISEGNQALINRMNTLNQRIENRHETVPQITDHSRYETVLGTIKKRAHSGSSDESDDEDEDLQVTENDIDLVAIEILQNVAGFQHENEQWRDLLHELEAEAEKHSKDTWKSMKKRNSLASSKIIENSVQRSMKEIDSRTVDIQQLKLVLLSKDSATGGELLNGIEDRHKVLNESNNDIIKSHAHCTEYCLSEQNNSLWWKVIEDIILNKKIMKTHDKNKHSRNNKAGHEKAYESTSLSLMRPSVPIAVTPVRKGTIRGLDYNENLKFVLSTTATPVTQNAYESKIEEEDHDDEAEGWWLMMNEDRNALIESLDGTSATNHMLCKLAVYVSRILKKEALSDKVTALYIGIDLNAYPSSRFRALASLFDGVLIAKLLCLINEDYIDFRAIHKPNIDNKTPLHKHEINENISVILSSLKSCGIALKEMYTVKDWWNPNKHCPLLINVLTEIASHTLDRFCSYKKHPELLLLKRKTETAATMSYFTGEKWIKRWINFILQRSGAHNASIDNHKLIKFNKDIMRILTLLKKRTSVLLHKPNATKLDNAKAFIKIAKTSFNINTPIEAQDFTNNNRFCQLYFAAQIFDKMNGLHLAQNEQQELKLELDESTMAWLNSFGLRTHADSLDDITSGILLLKVLDRLKKGAVVWKKTNLKVRHKFDHVVNCNYVVEICQKQLSLRFVNISGIDIVDKNTQIIKSILWQMMRYQSIKILSDLQFGSNISKVNNSVIIDWCNKKLGAECKKIKRLNDRSLTTGVYYLELIRAVIPKAIDDDLIHFKVASLSSAIKKDFHLHDKHYKKRKENFKYAMTIIRRYGVDLFINVENLFRVESRAVVSILAALMTIYLSTQHMNEKRKSLKVKQKIVKPQTVNVKDKSALNMEHVDDIDIDSILDSVDSLYQK